MRSVSADVVRQGKGPVQAGVDHPRTPFCFACVRCYNIQVSRPIHWQLSTRNRHSSRQSSFAMAQKRAMLQSYIVLSHPIRSTNRHSSRNSVSVPKCLRRRIEVHLHRHAAVAGRLRGYLCQWQMAANGLMPVRYSSSLILMEESDAKTIVVAGIYTGGGNAFIACESACVEG